MVLVFVAVKIKPPGCQLVVPRNVLVAMPETKICAPRG